MYEDPSHMYDRH
jgi:hypothetical protein